MTDTSPSAAPAVPAAKVPPRRRKVALIAAAAVVVAALLAAGGFALYVRGGGPAPDWAAFLRPGVGDVLKPSTPAEVVLRTLRLAGFQRAAVGDADGTVVVRIETPELRAPADAALTWQTGMAAASAAYPAAKTIVVQVFSPSQSLLEVSAPAAAVAAAVQTDDAAGLRRACTFRYLSETGGG